MGTTSSKPARGARGTTYSSSGQGVTGTTASSSSQGAEQPTYSTSGQGTKATISTSSIQGAKENTSSFSREGAKATSPSSSSEGAKATKLSSSGQGAKATTSSSSIQGSKENTSSFSSEGAKASSSSSSSEVAKATTSSSSGQGAKATSSSSSIQGAKENTSSSSSQGAKETTSSSSSQGAKATKSSSSSHGAKATKSSSSSQGAKATKSSSSSQGTKETKSSSSSQGAKATKSSSSSHGAKATKSSSLRHGAKATKSSSSSQGTKATKSSSSSQGAKGTTSASSIQGAKATKSSSADVTRDAVNELRAQVHEIINNLELFKNNSKNSISSGAIDSLKLLSLGALNIMRDLESVGMGEKEAIVSGAENVRRELEATCISMKEVIEREGIKAMHNIDSATKYGVQELHANLLARINKLESIMKKTITYQITMAEREYAKARDEMLEGLTTHYQNKLSHLTISPLNDSVAAPLDDFYVPLNIRLMQKKYGSFLKTETRITNYKYLFSQNSKLKFQKTFIQGEAGSGKSTFLAKLVMDWCGSPLGRYKFFTDLETLKYYKFIFHITLRNSVQEFQIEEMIKQQIIDSIYVKEECENAYKLLNEIMKCEHCLVLLDGLDEWIRPGDDHNLPTLVANHSLCTLLITTRPLKLAEGKIKDSEIDILFHIEGINDPFELSRRILSRKYQDKNVLEAKNSAFTVYIQKNELKELLQSPMMLSIMVCWHDEGGREQIGSKCEIYSLLIDSLLKKVTIDEDRCDEDPRFNCFAETQYIQPNIHHVNQIAEAAFRLLFSDKQDKSLVFGAKDLKLKDAQRKFALKTGILTQAKTSDVARFSSTFSFFHKSIQEFLAAYYIACNENVINEIIAGYLEQYEKSYLAMTQLFIFLCGVNISAGNALSDLMNESNVKYNSPRGDTLYQDCVFAGYREAVANRQSTGSINLRLTRFVIDDISPDLQNLWDMNASNVVSIIMLVYVHRVYARFKIDLSLCHKLKSLKLSGGDIQFIDSASLATSSHKVCIVINSAGLSSVLGSIEDILFVPVKCSSIWLRSLFSTLLTRDHEVKCELESYIPSSDQVGAIKKNVPITYARITTGSNKTFNIDIQHDSPGFWEALHGLNIRSLCLSLGGRLRSNNLWNALSSLTQLETLTLNIDISQSDIPDLRFAFRNLNIRSLGLGVEKLEKLSTVVVDDSADLWWALSSLRRLETLTLNKLRYINIRLPHFCYLKNLNIYCHGLHPSQLREIVEELSEQITLCSLCTQRVEIKLKLEFGCAECTGKDNVFKRIALEDYNPILEELEKLKNPVVKQPRILDRTRVTDVDDDDVPSAWSVRGYACVEDDNRDDDFLYDTFLKQMDNNIVNRISMRLKFSLMKKNEKCVCQ